MSCKQRWDSEHRIRVIRLINNPAIAVSTPPAIVIQSLTADHNRCPIKINSSGLRDLSGVATGKARRGCIAATLR